MKNKKGILIAFEGPEGSGKSTQVKLSYERLLERGIPAILTKEPDGAIREVLLSKDFDVFTESLLFIANRNENFLGKIIPALKNGEVAITDRCSASTAAYQFYGGGISKDIRDLILRLDALARHNCEIDINVLLDCPIELGFKRIKSSREKLTVFEKKGIDFHERVRKGYLQQAKDDPEHWKIFDGEQSIEELREEIWDFLKRKFNLEKK